MISLTTPIESVPKIHKRIVPALKRLGIKTIRDLLFHFPTRYEDFSDVRKINQIAVGETVTVEGEVVRISIGRTLHRRMTLLNAVIRDETDRVTATWFNQPFLAQSVKAGVRVRLSGKVAQGPKGIYLQNPAYEKTPNPWLDRQEPRDTHGRIDCRISGNSRHQLAVAAVSHQIIH